MILGFNGKEGVESNKDKTSGSIYNRGDKYREKITLVCSRGHPAGKDVAPFVVLYYP